MTVITSSLKIERPKAKIPMIQRSMSLNHKDQIELDQNFIKNITNSNNDNGLKTAKTEKKDVNYHKALAATQAYLLNMKTESANESQIQTRNDNAHNKYQPKTDRSKSFMSGLAETVHYSLGMFTLGLLRPFFNELLRPLGIKVQRPKKKTCSYHLGTQLGRPLILLACGVKGVGYACYFLGWAVVGAVVASVACATMVLGAIAYGGTFIGLAILKG